MNSIETYCHRIWPRINQIYCVSKNKCKTNKCENACWEMNVTSKSCDLTTSAMSYKPSEKWMRKMSIAKMSLNARSQLFLCVRDWTVKYVILSTNQQSTVNVILNRVCVSSPGMWLCLGGPCKGCRWLTAVFSCRRSSPRCTWIFSTSFERKLCSLEWPSTASHFLFVSA